MQTQTKKGQLANSQDELFIIHPKFPSYKISNEGRVWSEKNGKFLKPQLLQRKRGYYAYVLYTEEKERVTILVHRLVYEAFTGTELETGSGSKMVIHHIDNDPSNNHFSNLELLTRKENIARTEFKRRGYNFSGPKPKATKLVDSDGIEFTFTSLSAAAEYIAKIQDRKKVSVYSRLGSVVNNMQVYNTTGQAYGYKVSYINP